jgi:hypothetical protein
MVRHWVVQSMIIEPRVALPINCKLYTVESAGVKFLLHFTLTFVGVFRTDENIISRSLVLAQFSQPFL